MIPNDVKIGLKCYTRISDTATTLVKVIEDTKEGTKRYRLQRVDTGAILRRLRGPGELHETPGPWHRAPHQVATLEANPNGAEAAPRGKKAKGGPRKVATMSKPTQTELLAKLESLPADTRNLLRDLFAVMAPASPAAASGGEVPRN